MVKNPRSRRATGSVVFSVAHEVDHGRGRQDRNIIFALIDLDSVGIGPGKICLRYPSDFSTASLEGVFHVKKTAGDFVIIGARHIDEELVLEKCPLFDDLGKEMTVAVQLLRRLQ